MAMSRLNQANKSITKAKDFRDDIANLMRPYANWEQYLTPAPLSIALLGQLVRICAAEDFSINRNLPKDGFKFIRYPDSFKACLMQVCNSGWHAFNEAHKNMDQIRLYTGQVPDYIKNVVGIIIQEDTDLVKAFLPAELKNIENISSECLQLAEQTKDRFTDVINLMQELVEALINSRQSYDVEFAEIKKKIEAAKIREKSAKEANARAEKAYEEMRKRSNEAMDDYKKAIGQLPSGWEILGMKLLLAVPDLATHIIAPGLSAISTIAKAFQTKQGSTTSHTSPEKKVKANDIMSANNILAYSTYVLLLSAKVSEFHDEDKMNWKELYDQKNQSVKSDFVKTMFEDVKQKISKEEEGDVKTEALSICDKGVSICTELAKYAPKGECNDAKTKELIEAIESLNTAAQRFDSKSKGYTNRPPFSVDPPYSSKEITAQSSEQDVLQMHVNISRFRVQQSEAMLSRVTKMYEKNLENMEKKRKELDDIVIELRRLEPKAIEFDQKIKVLAKGLEAMGRVKEQWEKMVQFFQIVSNIVKTTLTQQLTNFNQTIEISVKTNYTYTKFIKDKIYTNALNASAYAYLVNMISTTYTEVSVQYLMGSVSALGRLMTMDPNETVFVMKMDELWQNCESAQDGIKSIAANNKKDFDLRCQNRIIQIQTVLNPELPPISEEKSLKLKEIVEEGLRASVQQDQDPNPAAETGLITKDEADQFV